VKTAQHKYQAIASGSATRQGTGRYEHEIIAVCVAVPCGGMAQRIAVAAGLPAVNAENQCAVLRVGLHTFPS
jgi:hypothetical protein